LVFVRTSPFRPGPKRSQSTLVPLRRPTADTALLVGAAVRGIRSIYASGYEWSKAGVMLLDLVPDHTLQYELDLDGDDAEDSVKLMLAMDAINSRYGKGTVHMASSGARAPRKVWGMKQERRTPHYTTRWDDLLIARA
jgi:DNA polymerase V